MSTSQMRTYSSWEELRSVTGTWEDMERNRAAADARIQPWQHEIKPGDCIFLLEHGLYIFAKVLDPVETEKACLDLTVEEDQEQLAYVMQTYDVSWASSYRFTRAYSIGCPEGELGDMHLSRIRAKITPEFMALVEAQGWTLPMFEEDSPC